VNLTIDMSITSRTGDEMKTTIPTSTDVWPLGDLRMNAAGIASVSGASDPDTSEVSIEDSHHLVGDVL
jgi:hypothetical protein